MTDLDRSVHESFFSCIDRSRVYGVEILEYKCKCLIEIKGTEHDQYKKSLGWRSTRQ